MRITICGHAALLIETSDQRLLVDPVFSDRLIGGALGYHPAREFDLERMPDPTGLVITHAHFDHFHSESLRKLSPTVPVFCADDARLIEQLRAIGFPHVTPCRPWETLELGETRLMATPSEHEEPEFGVIVHDERGVFWHMADAEVDPEIGRRLAVEYGRIHLVSVKYQPVVRASMGYQRGRGAAFDKREVLSWLEAACICNPSFAFPYASGLCFSGRHAWFNRYAFPLTAEEAAALLQARLGDAARASAVRPGDVLELGPAEAPRLLHQGADFVRCIDSSPVEWEPVDSSSLAGLESRDDRRWLEEALAKFIDGPLASWIRRCVDGTNSVWARYGSFGIVWQLTVHVAREERWTYHVDFRSADARPRAGRHREANYFTHVSGQAVYEVLSKQKPGLIFWLAGDARSYEKVMGASESGFFCLEPMPFPEDDLADPFTYYLRHFGTGELSPNEPEMPEVPVPAPVGRRAEPSELEVLARQGENDRVLGKKVLLAHLALRESARLHSEPTTAEVQATADEFRRQIGLTREADMREWLRHQELSLEAFSGVMRDFTAVLKMYARHEASLASRVEDHRRVIAGRNRRLFT